jgi:hypothetical protein
VSAHNTVAASRDDEVPTTRLVDDVSGRVPERRKYCQHCAKSSEGEGARRGRAPAWEGDAARIVVA